MKSQKPEFKVYNYKLSELHPDMKPKLTTEEITRTLISFTP